ncbi:MAG: 50S ribosomal protein L10 [Chloroflexi bacterium]|nr:50S ribosomal protein L10 [Chloroflexota bacterium]
MPTAEKAQMIDELTRKLRDSKGVVLLDYRGLNVADISTLRRQLREQEIEFQVAKNTLLRIAAERAEVSVAPELLTGPTAVAFGWRDEVSPAKLLTDFARRNRVVQVKGGILGGRSMDAESVGRVAELPGRDQLLAQLIGLIQAPAARILGAIQAPAREVAGLAQALRDKQGGEPAAV